MTEMNDLNYLLSSIANDASRLPLKHPETLNSSELCRRMKRNQLVDIIKQAEKSLEMLFKINPSGPE